MEAVRETTDWGDVNCANHTYLLDGTKLVAYIKAGETVPFYFKNPIKGFDVRRRTFEKLKTNPFKAVAVEKDVIKVAGSKGSVYEVDVDAKTCTCPGFQFRGDCKHIKEHIQ
jgi:hypothetical protein